MHLSRIGLTPVKGGRHQTLESVPLTAEGPLGDRRFCLVEADAPRCLRTVENPTLLATSASWDGTRLRVDLPTGTVTGAPTPTGMVRAVDYWGRTAQVALLSGPWAQAYSAHLGRDVVLGSVAAGEVVYGAAVTIVTSGSLARLAEEVAAPVDAARFRATFEVDTGDAEPHVEDDWRGRRLLLGDAEVRVLGPVPRCPVIDLAPASGVRDLALLKALAGYRRGAEGMRFGVNAEVVVPGRVRTGDPVTLA